MSYALFCFSGFPEQHAIVSRAIFRLRYGLYIVYFCIGSIIVRDVRHLRPGWRISLPDTEPIMTRYQADAETSLRNPHYNPHLCVIEPVSRGVTLCLDMKI